jgi:hypothetical protein
VNVTGAYTNAPEAANGSRPPLDANFELARFRVVIGGRETPGRVSRDEGARQRKPIRKYRLRSGGRLAPSSSEPSSSPWARAGVEGAATLFPDRIDRTVKAGVPAGVVSPAYDLYSLGDISGAQF